MQISDRLRMIAGCVGKGSTVADVGCDHGLTSIYLVKYNIASKVYALDINPGPLESARKNISSYGLDDRIVVRQSDGVRALYETDNVDTILISGMGGNLIIDILSAPEYDAKIRSNIKELILSPQSDIHKVRRFLHTSGYRIDDEMMVYDAGKYYNIICAIPGSEQYDDDYAYRYGKVLIEKKDELFRDYINKELEKKQNILQKIKNAISAETNDKNCDIIKNDRLKSEALSLKKDIDYLMSITVWDHNIQ